MAGATDDVPWLSEGELRSWMTLMAMTQTLPAALDAQLKREAGINAFEYHILAALSESPDRTLRMSQLAAIAVGSLSRLSHAVGRLEKAGWVVRQPCSDDGRHTEAHLTSAGMRKVRQTAPNHVREARRLVLDVLTPDQVDQLAAIARAVVATTSPQVLPLLDGEG
jgi:DNA-binding MarR family transcriptional regulator